MKNILCISPDFDIESFWISEEEGTNTEVMNDLAPLGLATIAAMTPDTYEVDIWDEVIHGRITPETKLKRDYAIVAVTGYNNHFFRCVEIARMFRERGMLTVVGGPGVSGMPERYRDHFDILFIGEAERTWPQFLKDYEAGCTKSEYRQIEKIDLAESPLPKWDSIAADMKKYAMGGVQTTRGCPFDCEFCDVIYLYGRKMRHKPIENVIAEVKELERLGASTIMFCDDEFVGDSRYTKEFLKTLIPVNNSFKRPLSFITQCTINASKDDELLELLADTNFDVIFIGIETPNEDSLRETGKFHNLRMNLVADIRKILSYGIAIRAGLIVGFDHDTTDIFQIQEDFVKSTFLPSVTLSMLRAIPGTRLWRRLRQEGRVLDISTIKGDYKTGKSYKNRSYTSIIPKLMTRVELMQGYRRLAEKLYSWESFSQRVCGFVSNIKRPPNVAEPLLTAAEMESFRRVGATEPESKQAVEEIIAHTERVAPFMMRKVRMLTFQHARHKQTFDNLYPYIDKLIELESSGQLSFNLDNRPIPIPEELRTVFKRGTFFADMHRRVYENLFDKKRAPEALTEIFVDFLVRLGDGFKALEPHHTVFLNELSDRTCRKFNDEAPENFVPTEAGKEKIPDVAAIRLSEDVLRSIEQELVLRKHSQPVRG